MTDSRVARLAMFTLDTDDVPALSRFWSAVLGLEVAHEQPEYAMLTGEGVALGIGLVPDYQRPQWPDAGSKQFHLDLAAADVEAAASRCVELGASRPDEQPGDTWVVLLDPAGHPFCVTDAANWG